MIRVTQLSDTHFGLPGHRSHGGFGYDTDASFDAVLTHLSDGADLDGGRPDLVVVTGDLADNGHPDQYAVAVERLRRIEPPVNVCPGNHDFDTPLRETMARAGVGMQRSLELGNWLFVFADSTHDGKHIAPDGRLVDRDDRIESTGQLGNDELSALIDLVAGASAPHVFIWVHHPPAMQGSFAKPGYDDELTRLVETHDRVRGFGAGHVHTDTVARLAGRPVFVCPALTINIDFLEWTTLPPGYRTYTFADDGTISSRCHLVGEERWRRRKLPDAAVRMLRGETTWDEMVRNTPSPNS